MFTSSGSTSGRGRDANYQLSHREYLMSRLLLVLLKYFSSIGQELAEPIPKSNHTSEYYMKPSPNKHSILCKNKKSSGDDRLSLLLLKQLRGAIDVAVAMLVNLALS